MNNIFLSSFIWFIAFFISGNLFIYSKWIKVCKNVDSKKNIFLLFLAFITIICCFGFLVSITDDYGYYIYGNNMIDVTRDKVYGMSLEQRSWGSDTSIPDIVYYTGEDIIDGIRVGWFVSQSLSCIFIGLFLYFLLKVKNKKLAYLFLLDSFIWVLFGSMFIVFMFF